MEIYEKNKKEIYELEDKASKCMNNNDYYEAINLYLNSLKIGGCSYNNLGFCYEKIKNYELAIKYYKKAASKQKNTAAMGNIAYLYENGLGVEKDNTKAIYWYKKILKELGPSDKEYIEAKESIEDLINEDKNN